MTKKQRKAKQLKDITLANSDLGSNNQSGPAGKSELDQDIYLYMLDVHTLGIYTCVCVCVCIYINMYINDLETNGQLMSLLVSTLALTSSVRF